jgi:hypothetical protein
MLTVRPGETVEVGANLPSGQLSPFGDLNDVFANTDAPAAMCQLRAAS